MKQIHFLGACALALLATACSNEEQGPNPTTPSALKEGEIAFDVLGQSRGIDVNTENLTGMYVIAKRADDGSSYFSDILFNRSDGIDGVYTFLGSPTQYWPSDNSTLNFYLYSSSNDLTAGGNRKEGCEPVTDGTNAKINFTVNKAFTDQADFIVATVAGTQNGQTNQDAVDDKHGTEPNQHIHQGAGTTHVNFGHALAKINIKAKNNANYEVKIKGVRYRGFRNKATYDFIPGVDQPNWGNYGWNLTQSGSDVSGYYTMEEATTEVTLNAKGGDTAKDIATDDYGNTDAMIIPHDPSAITGLSWWTVANDASAVGTPLTDDYRDAGIANKAWISLLVQINTADDKSRIFPTKVTGDNFYGATLNGVDQPGYAWVVIPFDAAQKFLAGYEYTLTVDFTSGAGYVDPDQNPDPKPDPTPGEGPKNPTPNDDPIPDPGPDEDPTTPGPNDPVINGSQEIKFGVVVTPWNTTGGSFDVNLTK